jgi:hypothetical protein
MKPVPRLEGERPKKKKTHPFLRQYLYFCTSNAMKPVPRLEGERPKKQKNVSPSASVFVFLY